jgi:hypothetical protein
LEKPNAAFAKFSRVLRGRFFLFHGAHPLRVLPSSKPGAIQFALGGNQGDAVSVQHYPVSKLIGLRRATVAASRHQLLIKAVQ